MYEIAARTTTLSLYRINADTTEETESIAKDIDFHGFGTPRWSRKHIAVIRVKKAQKSA